MLQRARHLRVKMLVALGAATVAPLLFLFFSLSTQLSEQAEELLQQATVADLRGMQDRLMSSKAKARTLASRARGNPSEPAVVAIGRDRVAELEPGKARRI